jgi:hypothetical protein
MESLIKTVILFMYVRGNFFTNSFLDCAVPQEVMRKRLSDRGEDVYDDTYQIHRHRVFVPIYIATRYTSISSFSILTA